MKIETKVYSSGTQVWHYNNELHREDGPSVIDSNGLVFWYYNDKDYSFNEWIKKVNISEEYKFELALRYG